MRKGQNYMNVKLGICNFCVPGTGVFAPQIVSEMGLDGMSIEFGSYEHGWALSQKKIMDLYLDAQQKYGIEYPNIGCSDGDNVPFYTPQGDPMYDTVQHWVTKAVDAAAYMKIPMVFFSNFNASLADTEEKLENTAKRYRYLCDYAADKGIEISCENPLSVEKQLQLVEMVDRKNFSLFYDSDNYTYFTDYKQLDVLKGIYPHMGNQLHVKDSTKGCIANAIIGSGVADFYDSINYLKEQNYEGWIILENLYELAPMRHLNPDYFELMKEDVRVLKEAVK